MAQIRTHRHPNLGRLVQPRHYHGLPAMIADAVPWAADNDGFRGVDLPAFCRMLDALQRVAGSSADHARRPDSRCLFITVPDVVADAGQTARLFERWAPAVLRHGLPAALVAQDGLEELPRGLWTPRPPASGCTPGG
jgi:hypothetical protein